MKFKKYVLNKSNIAKCDIIEKKDLKYILGGDPYPIKCDSGFTCNGGDGAPEYIRDCENICGCHCWYL